MQHRQLLCLDRERLIRYKFRWAEADEEPQDNQLTINEMQDFRHPEQSSKMIIRMAKDIIENLGICLYSAYLINSYSLTWWLYCCLINFLLVPCFTGFHLIRVLELTIFHIMQCLWICI